MLIAGNHDETLSVCEGRESELYDLEGIHYLNNESIVIEGLKFFGSPLSPSDFSMAFTDLHEDAESAWAALPKDVDVLITHRPGKGFLDASFGCSALSRKVVDMPNLKAHLFGHIHQAKAMSKIGNTFYSNAAESINVLEVMGDIYE